MSNVIIRKDNNLYFIFGAQQKLLTQDFQNHIGKFVCFLSFFSLTINDCLSKEIKRFVTL